MSLSGLYPAFSMAAMIKVRASSLLERFGAKPPSSPTDTKLKSDIAESAVVTELLRRGFRVLRPVGDRLPYDVAIEERGRLIRLQVKHAWFDSSKNLYFVDTRRTKTNRRQMIRRRYSEDDFDFAIIYIGDKNIFYVIPEKIFNQFSSTIGFAETEKRQREPKSSFYRERWDLLRDEG